jgi:hypothetical protein
MLRTFFSFIVFIHGLIHLMGFAKAFKLAEISQLTLPISPLRGVCWLAAMFLFLASIPLLLFKKEAWWQVAIAAGLLSQTLILLSWQDAKFGTIANIIIFSVAIFSCAEWHFHHLYANEVKAEITLGSQPSALLTEADLAPLPDPIKKYIRLSGALGKPKVTNFRISFTGKIRKNQQSAWMPFTSEQYNFMEPVTRLFFMKATMKGLPVAGYHRFKDGKATMDIRLWSLAPVAYQAGDEMNVAETVTFFNDMCCMAPATLIDKRIKWSEIESKKVKAEFTNNKITITAWLDFNEQGELVNFISDDRFAVDAGRKLRWSTPLKDYRGFNGYRIPSYAEAIYSYPEGNLSYGALIVSQVEYNCRDFR